MNGIKLKSGIAPEALPPAGMYGSEVWIGLGWDGDFWCFLPCTGPGSIWGNLAVPLSSKDG